MLATPTPAPVKDRRKAVVPASHPTNTFDVSKTDLGHRILALREQKELRQEDLAYLVGKSRAAIAQWERGGAQPGFSEVRALAYHLNTTPEYIAFGIAAKKNRPIQVVAYQKDTGLPKSVSEVTLDDKSVTTLTGGDDTRVGRLRGTRVARATAPFHPDDLLIIDEGDTAVHETPNHFVLFIEAPMVGQLWTVPGNRLTYQCRIGDYQFSVESANVRIIGRVVGHMVSFRE